MKFQALCVLAISLALAGCASSSSIYKDKTPSVTAAIVHTKSMYVRDESVAVYSPTIGGAAIRSEGKVQVLWNAHYTDAVLKQTNAQEAGYTLTHVSQEINMNRNGTSAYLLNPKNAVKVEFQSKKDNRLVNDAKAHLAKHGSSLQTGKDRSFYVKKEKSLAPILHVKPSAKSSAHSTEP